MICDKNLLIVLLLAIGLSGCTPTVIRTHRQLNFGDEQQECCPCSVSKAADLETAGVGQSDILSDPADDPAGDNEDNIDEIQQPSDTVVVEPDLPARPISAPSSNGCFCKKSEPDQNVRSSNLRQSDSCVAASVGLVGPTDIKKTLFDSEVGFAHKFLGGIRDAVEEERSAKPAPNESSDDMKSSLRSPYVPPSFKKPAQPSITIKSNPTLGRSNNILGSGLSQKLQTLSLRPPTKSLLGEKPKIPYVDKTPFIPEIPSVPKIPTLGSRLRSTGPAIPSTPNTRKLAFLNLTEFASSKTPKNTYLGSRLGITAPVTSTVPKILSIPKNPILGSRLGRTGPAIPRMPGIPKVPSIPKIPLLGRFRASEIKEPLNLLSSASSQTVLTKVPDNVLGKLKTDKDILGAAAKANLKASKLGNPLNSKLTTIPKLSSPLNSKLKFIPKQTPSKVPKLTAPVLKSNVLGTALAKSSISKTGSLRNTAKVKSDTTKLKLASKVAKDVVSAASNAAARKVLASPAKLRLKPSENLALKSSGFSRPGDMLTGASELQPIRIAEFGSKFLSGLENFRSKMLQALIGKPEIRSSSDDIKNIEDPITPSNIVENMDTDLEKTIDFRVADNLENPERLQSTLIVQPDDLVETTKFRKLAFKPNLSFFSKKPLSSLLKYKSFKPKDSAKDERLNIEEPSDNSDETDNNGETGNTNEADMNEESAPSESKITPVEFRQDDCGICKSLKKDKIHNCKLVCDRK